MAEVTWIKGKIDPTQSGEYYVTLEAKRDIVNPVTGTVERWATTSRTCDSRHTSKRLIDSAQEDALSTSLRELEEELERDG